MVIVANWKQHKTLRDVDRWFDCFLEESSDAVEVVVAPSFVLIPRVREIIKERHLNISIASQTVSEFQPGPHTGEVGAEQLEGLVKYSIVGHSERRALKESPESVNKKIDMCHAHKITPLVCFSNADEYKKIQKSGNIVYCYEPVDSISTSGVGIPASIESVENMKNALAIEQLVYGGSVDKDNVRNYLKKDFISGFLVGSASLNPESFSELVAIVKESST